MRRVTVLITSSAVKIPVELNHVRLTSEDAACGRAYLTFFTDLRDLQHFELQVKNLSITGTATSSAAALLCENYFSR